MTVRGDGLRDWLPAAGSFAKRTLKEIATVNPRAWSPGTKMAVWAPTLGVTVAAFPHAALLGVGHPVGLGALNSAIAGGTAGVLTKVGVKALELNRDVQDRLAGRALAPGFRVKASPAVKPAALPAQSYALPSIRPVSPPSPAPSLRPTEQLGSILSPSKPRLSSYDRAQEALRKKLPRIERYVDKAKEKGVTGDYRGALLAQKMAQSLGKKAIRQYGATLLKPDDDGPDLKSLIRHCDDLSGAIGDAGGVVAKPLDLTRGMRSKKVKATGQPVKEPKPVVNKLGHKSNQNFDRENKLAHKMLAAKMSKQGFDVASEPTVSEQRSSQGPRSTPKPFDPIRDWARGMRSRKGSPGPEDVKYLKSLAPHYGRGGFKTRDAHGNKTY